MYIPRYPAFVLLGFIYLFASVQGSSVAAAPERMIPVVIETEWFSSNRVYLPMEGPGFVETFSVEDLIASKKIVLSGSLVGLRDRPDRRGNAIACRQPSKSGAKGPIGWIRVQNNRRSLYWFRGAEVNVDVIDARGRTVPGTGYLCHASILIDCDRHNREFPEATPPYREFFSLSQGMNNAMLPDGFGVPVASDEKLTFNLRTVNRIQNKPVRIRLRFTSYLAIDDKAHPVTALSWCRPGAAVVLSGTAAKNKEEEHGHCSSDFCRSEGQDAPNDTTNSVVKNEQGQKIAYHWVLPPGVHGYSSPIDLWRLTSGGPIRAVMPHVHPFCEQVQLIERRSGYKPKILFTVHCRTDLNPYIRIEHLDYLAIPQGVPLHRNASYGYEAVFNNTSGVNQDAMVVPIIFFSDLKFKRPIWAS